MKPLLLCSGSQRQESFNTRLLQHIRAHIPPDSTVDEIGATEVDLPLFNQDKEDEPLVVGQVLDLHQRFARAGGIVIASPEYNCLPSPYLKNLIDWVSRLAFLLPEVSQPFRGKPVLLCTATTGWSGGAVGLNTLRTLLAYLGADVMGEQICVPYAREAWNDSDATYDFDPVFRQHINRVVTRFLAMTQEIPA